MRYAVVFLALMTIPAGAEQDTTSAKVWMEFCRKDSPICTAYIASMIDTNGMLPAWGRATLWCPPAGSTLAQLQHVIVKELDKEPDKLDLPFGGLATNVLMRTYPCKPATAILSR